MDYLLKNRSFKQIMMITSFFTLLVPAFSYCFSTHYLFSNLIKGHMRDIWHEHTKSISKQARPLISYESKSDKETTLLLFDNPLIIHASGHTKKHQHSPSR